MKTFKHSGDLGDIIYSLPTVKTLGGGVLYLDPEGGRSDPSVQKQSIEKKTKLTKTSIDFIAPLLKQQSYIKDVFIWKGEKVDYNLDLFREKYMSPTRRSKQGNLLDVHLDTFNLKEWDFNNFWLEINDFITLDRKIIIARSPRYQSSFGWLQGIKFLLRDHGIFVGLPKEHEYFEWTFDIKLPYQKVNDALELARIIKGSEKFISNATFALSLGVGMGHQQIYHEFDSKVPSTYFKDRKGIIYV